jgi:hypothetical protein
MSDQMERRMKSLAQDVTSNVVPSAQEMVSEYIRKAKTLPDEMRQVAERNLKDFQWNKYPLLRDQAHQRMADTRQRMEETLLKAQGEAVRLTKGIKQHFREREHRRDNHWKRVKDYWGQHICTSNSGKCVKQGQCRKGYNGWRARTNGKRGKGM